MTRSLMTSLAVVALLPLGLVACDHAPDVPRKAKTAQGEILTVQAGPLSDLRPVAGIMTTRDSGEAVARISGVLERLTVREGDLVTQGQVIGFVRDERLGLQTAAAGASVAAAEAEAARAGAMLKRTQTLFDKGIVSQARLDQDLAMARAAEAQVKAAKAQSAASSTLDNQGAILAPASGKVIRADVPAGAVVMPGQSVATITAGPRVVRFTLPEAFRSSLQPGQAVDLSARDQASSGQISQIYPALTSGQIRIDVTPSGLDALSLGETVTARFGTGTRTGIAVPERFVTRRYGLSYVQLVQKNNTVLERRFRPPPKRWGDRLKSSAAFGPGIGSWPMAPRRRRTKHERL